VDAVCKQDVCEPEQEALESEEDSEEEAIPEEAEIFSDVIGKNVSTTHSATIFFLLHIWFR